MVLDNISHPTTSERSERVSLSQPSLLYCMDKREKKLLKLNTKAQDCVSREKAQKILKKESKLHGKTSIDKNNP